MDHLRWILLLLGAGIIAVIYLAGRYRERQRGREPRRPKQEGADMVPDDRLSPPDAAPAAGTGGPDGGARVVVDDLRAEAAVAPHRTGPAARPAAPPAEEKLVVIYLVARAGECFRGDAILETVREAGMEHGEMEIFHGYADTDSGREVVYSMANIVEPGRFDPAAMAEQETPGLAWFLRLPGPLEGSRALAAMLESAQCMQRRLQGELRDASRSVLSKQTIGHLCEEIREFDRKCGIDGGHGR